MPSIKAVIFDLDDTLYPERECAFSGFAAVATAFEGQLGDPPGTIAQLKALFHTEHRPRVFDALLAQRGMPDDEQLIARMIETYRHHVPKISLYPDADAALTRLRPQYKLGLISDGRIVTQTLKLKALGLQPRLDKIIVTSELGPGYEKPDPRAFESMAESPAIEHAQCVYVADNAAKDFVAPNALGWTTVRIVRPDGIYRDVPPATGGSAGHTIDTLSSLDAILTT
jgi:putative hydrolase of the HAD superfamily